MVLHRCELDANMIDLFAVGDVNMIDLLEVSDNIRVGCQSTAVKLAVFLDMEKVSSGDVFLRATSHCCEYQNRWTRKTTSHQNRYWCESAS